MAIPQACCSIILVIVAATIAGTRWDQDVLEYIAEEYTDNVIVNLRVVDDNDSCPDDWSSIRAIFVGQENYCMKDSGYLELGSCSGNQKEKNGYREISGVGRKSMRKIDGKRICYQRADDWDYKEVAEQRA